MWNLFVSHSGHCLFSSPEPFYLFCCSFGSPVVILKVMVTDFMCVGVSIIYIKQVIPMIQSNLSLVVRKPVFGASDQIGHKPSCTATEDSLRLEISDLESKGIGLSV